MEQEKLYKLIIFLIGLIIFISYIAIVNWQKLKKSYKRKVELETKFEEIENKVNNLQLESLEYKLNPHLFKNILNSIQSHAYQTFFALDKLANVLDYILYESRN
jgi:hypothetical protein